MATEGGGKSNTLIYVLVALVIAWFIYQAVAKKTEKLTKGAAGEFGKGVGSGATHTLLSEGASALGTFLGGFLGGKKQSAANSDDEEDDEGGYDTSSFRVYDDE